MLKVITAPTIEPVSVAEAKAFCRVTHSSEDALFAVLIASARSRGEQITGRAFVEQTLELSLDAFPAKISLPRPPLKSLTSIKYTDTDGVEQTMLCGAYTIVDGSDSVPPCIIPAYGTTWPSTRDTSGAVRVRYVTGWPTVAGSPVTASTPSAIKAWIMCRVAGLYAQRENFVVGQQVFDMPRDHIDGLLDPFTILEVF